MAKQAAAKDAVRRRYALVPLRKHLLQMPQMRILPSLLRLEGNLHRLDLVAELEQPALRRVRIISLALAKPLVRDLSDGLVGRPTRA